MTVPQRDCPLSDDLFRELKLGLRCAARLRSGEDRQRYLDAADALDELIALRAENAASGGTRCPARHR